MNENGEGEICTRGRCTAMGYLFDKDKTLDTFDDDGWLHTGRVIYIYSYITLFTSIKPLASIIHLIGLSLLHRDKLCLQEILEQLMKKDSILLLEGLKR